MILINLCVDNIKAETISPVSSIFLLQPHIKADNINRFVFKSYFISAATQQFISIFPVSQSLVSDFSLKYKRIRVNQD